MNNRISHPFFFEEILMSSTPVLVDFFAGWCAPCNKLALELDRLRERHGSTLKLCQVDVDRESDLADRYRIKELPTVIFFRNGIPIDRFTGFRSAEEIDAIISK